MSQYTETKKICKDCRGTGYRRGGNPPQQTDTCGDCQGTDYVSYGIITLDLETALSDIIDKVDSMIAEQAAQREDLTTALEAIWNKVKNL